MSLLSLVLLTMAPSGAAFVEAAVPIVAAQSESKTPRLQADIIGIMSFEQRSLTADQIVPASGQDPGPQIEQPGESTLPEEIVVTAEDAPREDPLVRLNAQTFDVMQDVDEALVEPIAIGYSDVLPKPVRKGLSNFFRNLREPIVFLNFLLQGKPGKAVETVGRFAINSTIGIAGLVDVAKKEPFKLPHRPNGFANTLGFYGVKPGPFLVVPLVGPTTVRDLFGSGIDTLTLPVAVGPPFNNPVLTTSAYIVRSLDERIAFDDKVRAIRDSRDPYKTMRDTYLCQRQAAIDALRNRPLQECSNFSLLLGPASEALKVLTDRGLLVSQLVTPMP